LFRMPNEVTQRGPIGPVPEPFRICVDGVRDHREQPTGPADFPPSRKRARYPSSNEHRHKDRSKDPIEPPHKDIISATYVTLHFTIQGKQIAVRYPLLDEAMLRRKNRAVSDTQRDEPNHGAAGLK
jgi:hypothetical protein